MHIDEDGCIYVYCTYVLPLIKALTFTLVLVDINLQELNLVHEKRNTVLHGHATLALPVVRQNLLSRGIQGKCQLMSLVTLSTTGASLPGALFI